MNKIMVIAISILAVSGITKIQALRRLQPKPTPAAQAPSVPQLTAAQPAAEPKKPVVAAPVAPKTTAIVVAKPQTAQEIAKYQEEMLFGDMSELDKLMALAYIAPEADTILALKARAARVKGVEQRHLDLFDYYVETLPGVLKVRAEKRQKFKDVMQPKALIFIDNIRDRMQTLTGLTDANQKAMMLNRLQQDVNAELRKLYHFYFDAGSGMPDLQREIVNLYAKVKNAMTPRVDGTRKPIRSYYEVLGVAKTASTADIKKAYRNLALQTHPDKAAEADKDKAQERFMELNEAYAVLSDPVERAKYDTGN